MILVMFVTVGVCVFLAIGCGIYGQAGAIWPMLLVAACNVTFILVEFDPGDAISVGMQSAALVFSGIAIGMTILGLALVRKYNK